ncbi:PPOX class F420-dependent oxidoreductase [Streptomyces acidiscabies]|uniref:PPOX class F420-dependent oxidoreductase n=1 Tax=Streptomyces acidiscabies TaxID=42234 RepID=A0AAP6BDV3_9ACTN|nr:PPOX class F420-dependent oxidoreductase [Streptomyces acidiscabies]MBZ3913241.1 PPOX class F420-dependent oxidoreductase [Streptomyces acidiscabies]MDX2962937.1 PPOX class F420-dependent oxidoreductase [Streptomyces acidiscabies]MDX3021448.1 PPOX class F420-dependent oxidoreductase [Streptomyces acidiscabies]MDX3790206.1 PPOX class F420-dependent oxidoreductase [Streptomyces acidiscabies]GAQ53096.1 pyridoxamine 5'-phosphate oxidase [Streptomyces acidiscabies]
MAAELSDALKQHLDDTKVFATVATLTAGGHPHLTVVWIKRDGDDLVFSTTADRAQGKNLARDPRVTIMISPPENPYTYAEIRGTATITPDPDRALPNELSLKYTGQDYATFNPASKEDGDRVIVRVTPTKITGRF